MPAVLIAALAWAAAGCMGSGGTSPTFGGTSSGAPSGGSTGAGGSGGITIGAGGAPLGAGGAPTGDGGPSACQDVVFPFSATQDAFTAPPNAKWMHVKAWGAGGNQEKTCNGGMGGYAEGVFEIAPNAPLIVIVGGAGSAGKISDFRFGWGNSGGGGLSGVFAGPGMLDQSSWDQAYLIAGGGGGDGVAAATNGGACITAIPGNHPMAGGSTTMLGGTGLDSGVNGGGGGYRGGTGGPKHEAGVGGTGYPDPNGATKPPGWVDSLLLHANVGDALPPNTGDAEYDGKAGQTEANGQVVIHFTCEKPTIATK